MNAFVPVSLEDSDRYYELWQKTPRKSIDYTLPNLWGWQEYYGLEWLFDENLCWIRQTRPETCLWAPIGVWNQPDWRGRLNSVFVAGELDFRRVPEELAALWSVSPNLKTESREDRGQWEYLYSQAYLANLSGNRYHKKRNHYNAYVKTYGEPDYRPISPKIIEDVFRVQDDWCQWHECENSPSLLAENDAINRVLSRWDIFRDMSGGSLYVKDKMIAFSVGERLDADTLGVHYEKGLNGYKGVYQTMNLEFARIAGAGYKWINRAQDLDEEGLRQAKMTYLPEDFLRKLRVIINL